MVCAHSHFALFQVCISPTSGSTGTSTATLVSMFVAGESGYLDSTGATQPQVQISLKLWGRCNISQPEQKYEYRSIHAKHTI